MTAWLEAAEEAVSPTEGKRRKRQGWAAAGSAGVVRGIRGGVRPVGGAPSVPQTRSGNAHASFRTLEDVRRLGVPANAAQGAMPTATAAEDQRAQEQVGSL